MLLPLWILLAAAKKMQEKDIPNSEGCTILHIIYSFERSTYNIIINAP